jgi:hypothetical protein
VPTIPWIDFTSPIPFDVTAVDTLVFSIPSKISFSPRENEPLVLYTVNCLLSVVAERKKPTAPLSLPFT